MEKTRPTQSEIEGLLRLAEVRLCDIAGAVGVSTDYVQKVVRGQRQGNPVIWAEIEKAMAKGRSRVSGAQAGEVGAPVRAAS